MAKYANSGDQNPIGNEALDFSDVSIDISNFSKTVSKVNSNYSYTKEGTYTTIEENPETRQYINKTPMMSNDKVTFYGKAAVTTDTFRNTYDLSNCMLNGAQASEENLKNNYNYGLAEGYVIDSGDTEEVKDEFGNVINPAKPANKDLYNTSNTLSIALNKYTATSKPMAIRNLSDLAKEQ